MIGGRERVCPVCAAPMEGRRPAAVYCAERCRAAAYRARRVGRAERSNMPEGLIATASAPEPVSRAASRDGTDVCWADGGDVGLLMACAGALT
jgi:hypothetical protein